MVCHCQRRSRERPLDETVRFVGGPWDGDAGSYFGFREHVEMPVPGGRYVFDHDGVTGDARYVFRGQPADEAR
jgi:hypothetical protein